MNSVLLMCVCTDMLLIQCMDGKGIIAEIIASVSKGFRLKVPLKVNRVRCRKRTTFLSVFQINAVHFFPLIFEGLQPEAAQIWLVLLACDCAAPVLINQRSVLLPVISRRVG